MVEQTLKVDELPTAVPPRPARFMPVRDGGGGGERRIAFLKVPAASEGASKPGLVWLGGFKSDMRSTKASALLAWAEEHGRSALALDYSGHGESSGSFEEGTI